MTEVGVAAFAAAASVIGTVNLQGSFGEVQSVVLLASHKCAAPAAQECLTHMGWVLNPVSFGPAEAPGLYGSFTVVAVTGLLNLVACCAVKLAQGRITDTLTNQERWDIAEAKTLFPNASLVVLGFFYQGIILQTFQNYFKGAGGGQGFGISFVTGAFSLILVGLLVWFAWTKVRIRCEYHPLDDNFRRLRQRTWFERHQLVPDGIWVTMPFLLRMGAAIFPYKAPRILFAVVPWIRMFGFGFFGAALADSCGALYALAAVVFVVSALLTIVLRPYRFGLATTSSLMLHLAGLLTCILGLAKAALPCPIYLVVAGVVAIAAVALLFVGVREQRTYRPEVEALQQREQATQNPLLEYL